MQEYVSISGDRLVKLPADINPAVASFTEIVSVSVHAISRFIKFSHERRETIGVWGDGNLSYITCVFLRKFFPDAKIYVFGVVPKKLSDFTFVDDIVEGVVRIMQGAPEKVQGEDGLPLPPYAVYNIGNNNPENLLNFVDILQQELIRAKVLPEDYDFDAHKQLVPMQPGDVPTTYADTSALERDYGFKPSTSLRDGLRAFAEWYAQFYGQKA
jgi:nucleoside-diphosphate-sugar epimerase